MTEVLRTRDVVVFYKGGSYTTNVAPSTLSGGWVGGQGFQWTAPMTSDTNSLALKSDGSSYGGLALYGSDESSDKWTAMTGQQIAYGYVVLMIGNWLIGLSPNSYERYTYASRVGGGPLVPIDYHASDRLLLSLRGLVTIEDEYTLSGDPRAPNSAVLGYVAQAPIPERSNYLTIQLSA